MQVSRERNLAEDPIHDLALDRLQRLMSIIGMSGCYPVFFGLRDISIKARATMSKCD
ncbi:hypothetical protein D3C81_2072960 [compost metagenome]